MSRLARENPENDSYQSLEGQYEALTDRVDRAPPPLCPTCEKAGRLQIGRDPHKVEKCAWHRRKV